jgi:hypothetical protein
MKRSAMRRGAWVASARQEDTPRHHGRWFLVFHPADDERLSHQCRRCAGRRGRQRSGRCSPCPTSNFGAAFTSSGSAPFGSRAHRRPRPAADPGPHHRTQVELPARGQFSANAVWRPLLDLARARRACARLVNRREIALTRRAEPRGGSGRSWCATSVDIIGRCSWVAPRGRSSASAAAMSPPSPYPPCSSPGYRADLARPAPRAASTVLFVVAIQALGAVPVDVAQATSSRNGCVAPSAPASQDGLGIMSRTGRAGCHSGRLFPVG